MEKTMTVRAAKQGFYTNFYGKILPYIKIDPVTFNDRYIDRIYLNSWGEADDMKLLVGTPLQITATDSKRIEIRAMGQRNVGYFHPRPYTCPVCGGNELNMPYGVANNGYTDVYCRSSDCVHNRIVALYKFIKYALQVPKLTYLDVYTLCENKSLRYPKDIFKFSSEALENLSYTRAEVYEILNHLEEIKTIRATHLLYSLLPANVNEKLIYHANELYTSETIDVVKLPKEETNGKISPVIKLIKEYNKFLSTSFGKKFLELSNIKVEKITTPLVIGGCDIFTTARQSADCLSTIVAINSKIDYSEPISNFDFEVFTKRPDDCYAVVSSKEKNLPRLVENKYKRVYDVQDFVTKFNVPVAKDVIEDIEENPITLDKK